SLPDRVAPDETQPLQPSFLVQSSTGRNGSTYRSMVVGGKLRVESTELVGRRFLWNQARSRQTGSSKNLMGMHASSASVTRTRDYREAANYSLDSFSITRCGSDRY